MTYDPSSTPSAEHPFHVMTKPTGPACNLECEYCYYLDKADLYPERSDFTMDDDTLELFIRQYIEAQPGPVVTFAWQGGEPTLLGRDFFQKVIKFQEKHAPTDIRIQNTLQTNGTLLDEEWCQFLSKHDFLVGISIDGPRELHNQYRKTRADGATFDKVMNGRSLLKEYDVEHNVLCVVNSVNSYHPLEIYEFFKDQDFDWIQFIPLIEPLETSESLAESENDTCIRASDVQESGHSDTDRHQIPDWARERGGAVTDHDDNYADVVEAARAAPVTDRSVDPDVYGEFMCRIFDEWIRHDIGDISVRLFDQCLETLFRGQASLCVFQETCGSQVAMEHNGDVYACDHFVEPGFKRGNIHETHLAELVEAPEQNQFGEYKRDGLPSRCRTCNIREFCHGGCPKNWHLTTPAGEPGLNYLCAGYRRFFTYIQPYLELVDQTISKGLPLQFVRDAIAVRE